jgi:UDP-N-acetylmuramate dehydrogenase
LVQTDVFKQNNILWLGGGSNLLLTQAFKGLVVKLEFRGRNVQNLDADWAEVRSAGGENWHEFVNYCLDQNLGGLENLALIPGNVGTAPIQNIGAYGVELKDSFLSLKAFDLEHHTWREFNRQECQFDYRQSLFKTAAQGRYVICEVRFRLSRRNHNLRTKYGAIQEELASSNSDFTISNIAAAVVKIRQSKLPDPAKIGNSGSFFKNPLVSKAEYSRLKLNYPGLVAYPAGEQMKLAAGWLIEKAGWKGYRKGDAGVHNKQALVLVNYGQARGAEIKALAEEIQASVYNNFGLNLEAEVNII